MPHAEIFGEITEKSMVKTTVKTIVRVITATILLTATYFGIHYTLLAQGQQIDEVRNQVADHDVRIKKIEAQESDIAVMKEDLDWIKQELQIRDHPPEYRGGHGGQ
jgi:hypothetical protein